MRSHLSSIAKRKVSDFLLREEGMVGNRSAFATAALVSTTALAMTLLVAPDADAGMCGGQACDLSYCCWNNVNGGGAQYVCTNFKKPGWSCPWA